MAKSFCLIRCGYELCALIKIYGSKIINIGDNLKILKYIGPIGWFVGLTPFLDVFTKVELKDSGI